MAQIIEDYLNIDEPVLLDESVEAFEYHEYEAQNPAAINNQGEIRIDIQDQDLYILPSKSYLLVEGLLVQNADGAVYAADARITLTNNAIMFMFNNVKYQLNNNEVENIFSPGQATTMKGLLTYSSDFALAEGLNQCWQKDTLATSIIDLDNNGYNAGFATRQDFIITNPNPRGTFSFVIPLSHVFGFFDDYNKVVYGVKHTLTLIRGSDNDAIFRNNDVDAGKIVLSKLSWFVPHVKPSTVNKLSLYKIVEKKTKIPIGFRAIQCDSLAVPQSTAFSWRLSVKSGAEKPRWIIVGFQTGKSGNQERNPALFDHIQVKNIYVMLNSDRYPIVDLHLNFTTCHTAQAYKMMRDFKAAYYGVNEKESSNQISPKEFIDLYPLFVIDVRKQSERLKNTVQDIVLKAEFNAQVAANTVAYALVISDRLLQLQSDGNKFALVY